MRQTPGAAEADPDEVRTQHYTFTKHKTSCFMEP